MIVCQARAVLTLVLLGWLCLRLLSNRAAAKRAYYRRQQQSSEMAEEIDSLRAAVREQNIRLYVYENLVRATALCNIVFALVM
jgi:hypothetical protein